MSRLYRPSHPNAVWASSFPSLTSQPSVTSIYSRSSYPSSNSSSEQTFTVVGDSSSQQTSEIHVTTEHKLITPPYHNYHSFIKYHPSISHENKLDLLLAICDAQGSPIDLVQSIPTTSIRALTLDHIRVSSLYPFLQPFDTTLFSASVLFQFILVAYRMQSSQQSRNTIAPLPTTTTLLHWAKSSSSSSKLQHPLLTGFPSSNPLTPPYRHLLRGPPTPILRNPFPSSGLSHDEFLLLDRFIQACCQHVVLTLGLPPRVVTACKFIQDRLFSKYPITALGPLNCICAGIVVAAVKPLEYHVKGIDVLTIINQSFRKYALLSPSTVYKTIRSMELIDPVFVQNSGSIPSSSSSTTILAPSIEPYDQSHPGHHRPVEHHNPHVNPTVFLSSHSQSLLHTQPEPIVANHDQVWWLQFIPPNFLEVFHQPTQPTPQQNTASATTSAAISFAKYNQHLATVAQGDVTTPATAATTAAVHPYEQRPNIPSRDSQQTESPSSESIRATQVVRIALQHNAIREYLANLAILLFHQPYIQLSTQKQQQQQQEHQIDSTSTSSLHIDSSPTLLPFNEIQPVPTAMIPNRTNPQVDVDTGVDNDVIFSPLDNIAAAKQYANPNQTISTSNFGLVGYSFNENWLRYLSAVDLTHSSTKHARNISQSVYDVLLSSLEEEVALSDHIAEQYVALTRDSGDQPPIASSSVHFSASSSSHQQLALPFPNWAPLPWYGSPVFQFLLFSMFIPAFRMNEGGDTNITATLNVAVQSNNANQANGQNSNSQEQGANQSLADIQANLASAPTTLNELSARTPPSIILTESLALDCTNYKPFAFLQTDIFDIALAIFDHCGFSSCHLTPMLHAMLPSEVSTSIMNIFRSTAAASTITAALTSTSGGALSKKPQSFASTVFAHIGPTARRPTAVSSTAPVPTASPPTAAAPTTAAPAPTAAAAAASTTTPSRQPPQQPATTLAPKSQLPPQLESPQLKHLLQFTPTWQNPTSLALVVQLLHHFATEASTSSLLSACFPKQVIAIALVDLILSIFQLTPSAHLSCEKHIIAHEMLAPVSKSAISQSKTSSVLLRPILNGYIPHHIIDISLKNNAPTWWYHAYFPGLHPQCVQHIVHIILAHALIGATVIPKAYLSSFSSLRQNAMPGITLQHLCLQRYPWAGLTSACLAPNDGRSCQATVYREPISMKEKQHIKSTSIASKQQQQQHQQQLAFKTLHQLTDLADIESVSTPETGSSLLYQQLGSAPIISSLSVHEFTAVRLSLIDNPHMMLTPAAPASAAPVAILAAASPPVPTKPTSESQPPNPPPQPPVAPPPPPADVTAAAVQESQLGGLLDDLLDDL